ncbi:TAT-binding protein-like protein 7, AAA ATPase [Rhizoctonia solani]
MSDSVDNHQNGKRLTVGLGSMVVLPDGERRMTRGAARRTSGSDYGLEATNNTASVSPPATRRNTRGTRTPEAKPHPDDEDDDEEGEHIRRITRSGRAVKAVSYLDPSSDQSDDPHPPRTRTRRSHLPNDFITADDDEEELGEEDYGARRLRPRPKPQKPRRPPPPQPSIRDEMRPRPPRQTRNSARAALHDEDPDYSDGQHDSHDDDDMDLDIDAEGEDEEEEEEHEGEDDSKPRGYSLRQRRQVNYTIPQLLDVADNVRSQGVKPKGKAPARRPPPRKNNFGFSRNGTELSKLLGIPLPGVPGFDSDSDNPPTSPHKLFANTAAGGTGGLLPGGAGMVAGDLGGSGGPSNLGKFNADSALADADPLGTKQNISFDQVGGLDDHINSLKEMIQLPLLYPEIFQQFNIIPPRGVLFHGPPGTGKTLVARALAASSKADGKSISFFMRKGADCLSKWVGEAERQLRLLFDEARACQPSIIFFDEIDGLAPVRSSKQDQIHASIVSTLLALMDGMDGRGQVVVIGATNRPDAVDPALRRPGRFDREFYFGLPNLDARKRILEINTNGWKGWSGQEGVEHLQRLAEVTKGYGGADLRALCTEAALNAVQRRYPQIYKSSERLLVDPKTIEVQPRDFMVSVKKLIPSSARSTSSHASPLPQHLRPLLQPALDTVVATLEKSLPNSKKRNTLEEAEWEYDDADGGWEREMISQALETMRVHRPRILLHGPSGMGHSQVGAAVLHFLEGFHVQSMDLATLVGDSTRTIEAGIVQLFVEAKRHKPAVIYIPSLLGWCHAVPETARLTMKAMLDSIASTDPILVLAICDGDLAALPSDVRDWFGFSRDSYVQILSPTDQQRYAFFAELLDTARKPPNMFPDAVKRKKRVLEVLPVAPPLPPREPSKAEIAAQTEADMRTLEQVTYRLGPVLGELKKKFKRFTKDVRDEYGINPETGMTLEYEEEQRLLNEANQAANENAELAVLPTDHSNVDPAVVDAPVVNGTTDEPSSVAVIIETSEVNGTDAAVVQVPVPTIDAHVSPAPPPALVPKPLQIFDMDLEKMHYKLYYVGYLTGEEFLQDVQQIVRNAERALDGDSDRLFKAQQMANAAKMLIGGWEPQFKLECQRTAVREAQRREERKKQRAAEKAAKAKEKEAEQKRAEEGKRSGSDEPPSHSYGTRRATRHHGAQPDVVEDPVEIERRLKRQRSDAARESAEPVSTGGGPDVEMEDPDRAAKRARTTPMPDGSPVDTSQSAALAVSVGDVAPHAEEVKTPVDEAAKIADTYAMSLDAPPRAIIPMPDQEPEKPPPPFHIDESRLQTLADHLVHSTSALKVEQLEQLRALCLNCVWSHRSDWDRDDMVGQLMELVTDFVQQVQQVGASL